MNMNKWPQGPLLLTPLLFAASVTKNKWQQGQLLLTHLLFAALTDGAPLVPIHHTPGSTKKNGCIDRIQTHLRFLLRLRSSTSLASSSFFLDASNDTSRLLMRAFCTLISLCRRLVSSACVSSLRLNCMGACICVHGRVHAYVCKEVCMHMCA